jgi:prophage regulatory protein
MAIEIWRKERVLSVIGLKNTALYALLKKDEFPRPIKLGARAVGWKSTDVEAWVEARETKVA